MTGSAGCSTSLYTFCFQDEAGKTTDAVCFGEPMSSIPDPGSFAFGQSTHTEDKSGHEKRDPADREQIPSSHCEDSGRGCKDSSSGDRDSSSHCKSSGKREDISSDSEWNPRAPTSGTPHTKKISSGLKMTREGLESEKIYLKRSRAAGKRQCCHICRRTKERLAQCSRCVLTFCKRCLLVRHREDISEVLNAELLWVCPLCRTGCGPRCTKSCCSCTTLPLQKSNCCWTSSDKVVQAASFNLHDSLIQLETNESKEHIANRTLSQAWTNSPRHHTDPVPKKEANAKKIVPPKHDGCSPLSNSCAKASSFVGDFCCHSCRKRLLCGRAQCSLCIKAYCGRCLEVRHREDVVEVSKPGLKWVCPQCRKGCGPGCEKCCTKESREDIAKRKRSFGWMAVDKFSEHGVITASNVELQRCEKKRQKHAPQIDHSPVNSEMQTAQVKGGCGRWFWWWPSLVTWPRIFASRS